MPVLPSEKWNYNSARRWKKVENPWYRIVFESQGSPVNIVSGYGLDIWATGVQSPAEAEDFSSSFCVQTSSGAHPASYSIGTGGPSPPSSTKVRNE
jgi:hypothetical protein